MPRDLGLKARMYLTMFLLGIVYLGFIAVLSYYGLNVTSIAMLSGVFIFAQYYFSDRLVLMGMGAEEVSEEEAPRLHRIIRDLAERAGLPMPRVAIVQSQMPNAFATGRNQQNAVVAVTTGLMDRLNKEEMEAVLAHELSHVKHRDMLVITLASFLSTIAFFLSRYLLFFRGGRNRDSGGVMIAWIVSIVVWLISFLLIRALSRYREYAADRGAAEITGKPRNMIQALRKISGGMDRVSRDELKKAEGFNAFFIHPAVSGETLMSLLSTHPPVEKRIEALEELEG